MKTQKTEVKSPPSPPLLTGQFPDLSQTQTQLSTAGEKPEATAPPLIRSFKKKKKKRGASRTYFFPAGSTFQTPALLLHDTQKKINPPASFNLRNSSAQTVYLFIFI